MAIEIHPATPERWPDVERLFGPRGACAGCWCMWPRVTAAEFRRGKGAGNRRALKRLVSGGTTPGLVAYVDGEPAAWCAVAPRADYRRFEASRTLAPVDDRPVWSVPCFFVAREHRGTGLTSRLLRAAAAFAAENGASLVEGYPVDTRSKRQADAFVWTGLVSSFQRAGFTEALRRSPSRPIMRKRVRPRAARAKRAKPAGRATRG